MPPNTLKVDRSTRWGNPFRVRPGYPAAHAVADYLGWITGAAVSGCAASAVPPSLAEIRDNLGGRNLACWCPLGQACHAEVLLRLANPAPAVP